MGERKLSGKGKGELFSGFRVSVLQDEKVLEFCCPITCTKLTLLYCILTNDCCCRSVAKSYPTL